MGAKRRRSLGFSWDKSGIYEKATGNKVNQKGRNMADMGNFKCLRCGHEFEMKYTANVPEERACPKCGSNSVRLIRNKPEQK
ncbi:MAG: zinc ribbon domain-containing protein [bacterium]